MKGCLAQVVFFLEKPWPRERLHVRKQQSLAGRRNGPQPSEGLAESRAL